MIKNMNAKKVRGVLVRGFLTCLIVIGLGYISSAVTQLRCENAEALSLANGPMQGEMFYVSFGDNASQIIFSRIGAKFTTYTIVPMPSNNKRAKYLTLPKWQPMPSVDNGGRMAAVSQARISLPFLASVEHTAIYGSLGADGSTSHYLCLFGLTFKVREDVSWVS